MFTTYRKKIFITCGVIAVLCVAGIALLYTLQPKPTEVTTITTTTSSSLTVDLSNLPTEDAAKFKPGIDTSIVKYLTATSVNLDQVRSASVRSGSIVTSPGVDIPLTSVLVDTSPLNLTYKVLLEGGPSYERSIIYVSCAPQDQQRDPKLRCTDVSS